MSDDSPLFVSAIELISHSIEIYTEGDKRKFKFVILHLANAIELILKDCLIDEGVSIYEPKSSRTINIWMSFEKLDKVAINIPERPIIELLVDDRNTILLLLDSVGLSKTTSGSRNEQILQPILVIDKAIHAMGRGDEVLGYSRPWAVRGKIVK